MRGVVVFLVLVLAGSAEAAEFSTWAPWEPDSAATAWLLSRHVDPEARFTAVERRLAVPPESGIDTPDALYRRGATSTTFDSAVKRHGIAAPCIARLAPILRTLELIPWRKAADPQAEDLEITLVPLLPKGPGEGGLEQAFAFFDAFCEGAE